MPSDHSISMPPGWQQRLAVIGSPPVMRRALTAALVVGGILILLNQGDILHCRRYHAADPGQTLMTLRVPFCVSLYGAYIAYCHAVARHQP